MCTIRKSDMCGCGCGGLCTLGAIMRAIVWSFNAAASGVWPSVRHDGFPLDEDRACMAGTELANGVCGALYEMRADLLEFTSACGFKTWANTLRPCFLCTVRRTHLHEYPAAFGDSDWSPVGPAEYTEQVAGQDARY